MLLFPCFLALAACEAIAAPAISYQTRMLSDPMQNTTSSSLPSQSAHHNNSLNTVPITFPSIASASSSSPTDSAFSQLTHSSVPPSMIYLSSALSITQYSPPPSPASFTLPHSSTTFVTEVVTVFKTTTVDATPFSSTITAVVVTETATTRAATPSSTWDNRTLWATPLQMTDLSAFNVTYFPSGQRNLHIVNRIPAQAIAPTAKFIQNPPNADNSSTILQLVYPAHSVNPNNKPEGGADFYATPLNLVGARNVTLEYSVFFPSDFDWVKGGKLPGLFGGHTGCSGGVSACDCFSTRLMWRPQGVGELYLYAPKDKQTKALCKDVGSVCDNAYGFSIGRGAFNFTAGDWTHLRQSVVLNTPGQNDGIFTLSVDGRPRINRTDILYRDVTHQSEKSRSTLRMSITFASLTTAVQRVTTTTLGENNGVPQPAGFLGLFFSTFFGGHGKQYATPREQYTWFRDFAITRYD